MKNVFNTISQQYPQEKPMATPAMPGYIAEYAQEIGYDPKYTLQKHSTL